MKVVVTGGRGFIGRHLVGALIELGHEVTALGTAATNEIECVYRQCDITDFQKVRTILNEARPDFLYHLAALVSSKTDLRVLYAVNSEGTYNVCKAIYDLGLETRVVFSSSQAVYGHPAYLPVEETYEPVPASAYAKTKLIAELFCRAFSLVGVRVVALRISTAYGAKQSHPNVVSDFIRFAHIMKRINVYHSLERSEDLVHVNDVVGAMISCMSIDPQFDVINIGGGKEVFIHDLAQALGTLMDVPVHVIAEESFPPRRMSLCIHKARKLLGYNPISLEDALPTVLGG
jgi:UDP-glucose 4-epimerase